MPLPLPSGKSTACCPRVPNAADPPKKICIRPVCILADGVIFILAYLFFPALIFRTLSPVSSIWCAECTIRSSIASATVGSSMTSSRIGRSFASSGTRKRSSRMSSGHRSIFRSSASMVLPWPLPLSALPEVSMRLHRRCVCRTCRPGIPVRLPGNSFPCRTSR